MHLLLIVENRALGIPLALKHAPGIRLIVLDDGFQHRSVRPGLNILLTDYNALFTKDFLLPMGRLREFRSAFKRADIVIVTKTPSQLNEEEKALVRNSIEPMPYQKIYFSYFDYLHPYNIWNPQHSIVLNDSLNVLLVSAIANTEYLLSYLEEKVEFVRSMEFEDHHYFSKYEVGNMKKHYDNLPSKNKIIITTEKDATRLVMHHDYLRQEKLPIFVLPVQTKFHPSLEKSFIDEIKSFFTGFQGLIRGYYILIILFAGYNLSAQQFSYPTDDPHNQIMDRWDILYEMPQSHISSIKNRLRKWAVDQAVAIDSSISLSSRELYNLKQILIQNDERKKNIKRKRRDKNISRFFKHISYPK